MLTPSSTTSSQPCRKNCWRGGARLHMNGAGGGPMWSRTLDSTGTTGLRVWARCVRQPFVIVARVKEDLGWARPHSSPAAYCGVCSRDECSGTWCPLRAHVKARGHRCQQPHWLGQVPDVSSGRGSWTGMSRLVSSRAAAPVSGSLHKERRAGAQRWRAGSDHGNATTAMRPRP